MQTLENVVLETVQDFMQNNTLFTALDVSNKVKGVLPFARHREVRDVVRSLFTTDIEPMGWARSPIEVTLADGSRADALLYHPLSASWDLDAEYDAQRRTQVSSRPVPALSAPATSPAPVPTVVAAPMQTTFSPTPVMPAKDLWDQMFDSQPSLFPKK